MEDDGVDETEWNWRIENETTTICTGDEFMKLKISTSCLLRELRKLNFSRKFQKKLI